jgi:hypothetical protein
MAPVADRPQHSDQATKMVPVTKARSAVIQSCGWNPLLIRTVQFA